VSLLARKLPFSEKQYQPAGQNTFPPFYGIGRISHLSTDQGFKSDYMHCLLLSLLVCMNLFPEPGSSGAQLPAIWDKDFTITLSHRGSMSGGNILITFGYDSCHYEFFSGREAPVKGSFAMTTAEKGEILKKLRACQLDKIRLNETVTIGRDGWYNSICYPGHCVEGGSFSGLNDQDRARFQEAYQYLENLTWEKANKK
jgi:hypothetical protein